MRCRSSSHRLRNGWQAMSSLLRGPYTAASMIAAIAGGVLMLVPAGTAWPNLSFADALVSAAILDWVKGSLGLMFLLRRRLRTKNGG
jgi:hypothetical protein